MLNPIAAKGATNKIAGASITKNSDNVSNNITHSSDNEDQAKISSVKESVVVNPIDYLELLNIVVPKGLRIDASEKVMYRIIDDKNQEIGLIYEAEYKENFEAP